MNPRYEIIKNRRERQRLNKNGAKSEGTDKSRKSGSELEGDGSL
jgi:hypothetical protein